MRTGGSHSKKPDIEKVQSMIDNSKTDEATGAKAAESEKQAIDALEEYKESIARRNNVMVFHVDESKESETKERKEAEINFNTFTFSISGFFAMASSSFFSLSSYMAKWFLHLSSISFSILIFFATFS
jgi:ribulose 1,5-bisphosphate carboxylase large subunit-like protein